jgi:hypothetical protein
MPTFYPNDFDIDIDEFIDSCSSEEIKEMAESLKERGFLNPTSTEESSVKDIFWFETLRKLEQNRLSLSNEEEKIIHIIASRFI